MVNWVLLNNVYYLTSLIFLYVRNFLGNNFAGFFPGQIFVNICVREIGKLVLPIFTFSKGLIDSFFFFLNPTVSSYCYFPKTASLVATLQKHLVTNILGVVSICIMIMLISHNLRAKQLPGTKRVRVFILICTYKYIYQC